MNENNDPSYGKDVNEYIKENHVKPGTEPVKQVPTCPDGKVFDTIQGICVDPKDRLDK